jgi:hypothetical protein
MVVSRLWPWLPVPISTFTVPLGSMRMVAASVARMPGAPSGSM